MIGTKTTRNSSKLIRLSHEHGQLNGEIIISGSKSESNRWLILQKLFPEIDSIQNLSNANDTVVLQKALLCNVHEKCTIDIGHAGTAMRFLTAYFASTPGTHVVLTGSERMQQRPIAPLVDAMNALGADISYVGEHGYPPLEIMGKKITQNIVKIRADISSQYITALLLIGAKIRQGLEIVFEGTLTSKPYVEMTCAQLSSIGIETTWTPNGIKVHPKKNINNKTVVVASDWSSASYWYSMVALSENSEIELGSFGENSLQGDAVVVDIYRQYYGVETTFLENKIRLRKIADFDYPKLIQLNLNDAPDLAQTIAVTSAGLKIKTELTGLHTLKIKETDRLQALQNELSKLNVSTILTTDAIDLISFGATPPTVLISTYNDHRMAMAFAPFALEQPLLIEHPEVVEKSYPRYWEDLETMGFTIENL